MMIPVIGTEKKRVGYLNAIIGRVPDVAALSIIY